MEFPHLGSQCAVENCQENDFLPTSCVYCSKIFCSYHFNILSHNCINNPDKVISEPGNTIQNYICSQQSCKTTSPVEMNCTKCKKHFCLSHRHHGCFEKSQLEIAEDLENWEKVQEQFAAAQNAVDAEVNKCLRKSRNTVMVNMLQLMKIKGRAVGSKAIPMSDRRYFFVYPPVQPTVKFHPLAVFVNNSWTFGKVIDTMAQSLGLQNSNNLQHSVKLRLFYHDTGALISDKMDCLLSELFNNGAVTDGMSVILEYSNDQNVNPSLY